MDAGLGTLEELKGFALPSEFVSETDFDATVLDIGKGFAERFDAFCNRQLRRAVDDVYEADADTLFLSLPRYPVESISAIEVQSGYGESWVALTPADAIARLNTDSGVVDLAYQPGGSHARIRITYTGGYWHDKTGSDTQPAGSTALPDDIKLLWRAQCRYLWESLDHTGQTMSEGEPSKLGDFKLLPEVENGLVNKYRRYA